MQAGGEACLGTNPLGGACGWVAVQGGYICARHVKGSVTPKVVPRDKVKHEKQESVTPPKTTGEKLGSALKAPAPEQKGDSAPN